MGRVVKAANIGQEALAYLETDEARAAAELVVRANKAAAEISRAAKARVIELAVDVARRIVRREIEADAGALETIYASALESARGMERAKVRVHPEDRSRHPIDAHAEVFGFECDEDACVGRGGCVILAGGQEVDARLDTLLLCFEKAMKAASDVHT